MLGQGHEQAHGYRYDELEYGGDIRVDWYTIVVTLPNTQ